MQIQLLNRDSVSCFLEEDKKHPPFGAPSGNGWRISQGDAGDMINVNEEQGYFGGPPIDGYYNSEHKIVQSDKPLIYSYMGANAPIYWTHSEQYNYLMGKFTEDSDGR